MNKILKIYALIFALSPLLPLSLSAQVGDGSASNPFRDTITSSVTWNWITIGASDGKIYIGNADTNDLVIGAGGHLTIVPGATLVFTQSNSDLIVTSTGRITADGGTGLNTITFTKATGNSSWGHISFESMGSASASLFDNCLFEYGNVKNLSGSAGYGGAIHTNFSNLTISNSTFRDNIAEWGGAIFVNQNRSPSISNCLFEDNESDNGGGGIYCWNGSGATIKNCIFDNNNAGFGTTASNYSGGGVSLQTNTSVQLTNCTFVNNNSNHNGDGLQFYGTGGSPNAKNCIFWGSSSQIVGGSSSRLTNCAIQGSSTGNNTVNLNSSNSHTEGPNFNATDGSDWSIKFISPCRDAGTNSGAPSSDYDGDGRIGTTDIGAYEVQYSRWDGSSSKIWATDTNWEEDLAPTSGSSDVIIPGGLTNYPTSGSPNFQVGSGKYLILEGESQATFGTLTNNGTLKHLSDVDGIASLMFSSYSDAGTESFEIFVTGGGNPNYKWHYVAVPGTMSKTAFTNINAYNLLEYDESEIVDSNMDGWQWHDGYDGTNSFTNLSTKKGYNFYHTVDATVTLPTVTGLLRNLGGTVSLQYNGNGLNLLGNSLTCSIDWDNVVTSGDMRDAIYFTKDNALASYVDGVGTNGATNIIPPFQGFFVKALEAGCSIDFDETGVNTHGTVNRYKSADIIPLVRLSINKDGVDYDDSVVRLEDLATTEFDNEFDASKMFVESNTQPQIFTQLGSEKYSINSLPFPGELVQIPLIVKISEGGDHSFRRTELAGLDHTRVILRDLQENFTVDMADFNSYNFNSPAGIIDNRFVLELSPMGVGTEDILDENKDFRAYSYSNILNVIADNIYSERSESTINVYDLTGRLVMRKSNLRWSKGETKQFAFNQPEGIFIIEITNGLKRSAQKFVHK